MSRPLPAKLQADIIAAYKAGSGAVTISRKLKAEGRAIAIHRIWAVLNDAGLTEIGKLRAPLNAQVKRYTPEECAALQAAMSAKARSA